MILISKYLIDTKENIGMKEQLIIESTIKT
jgi:hypothetical protein